MLERDPKRRRLTPLNAPFRSPLRRPSTPTTTTSSTTNHSTSIPTTAAAAISGAKLTTTTPLRARPPRQFKSPILTRNDEEGLTPEILTLVKRKRALELQIKDERRQLEQAEQALKYEQQGEDEELDKLIVKWRRCAQKTAERVFISARNRIDRMGGFRTFMTQQKERASAWEDDSEGQQQKQESQEDDGRDEYETRGDEEEDEDVGDEFTMEIMLKMAGVEERLIGWDRELSNFIKK